MLINIEDDRQKMEKDKSNGIVTNPTVHKKRLDELKAAKEGILKALPFGKLIWITDRFSKMSKDELSKFKSLFLEVKNETIEKWNKFEGLEQK